MRSRLLQASRPLNEVGGNTFNPAWGRNYEGWFVRKSHGGVALPQTYCVKAICYGFLRPFAGAAGFSASIFKPFFSSSSELLTMGTRLSVAGALARNSASAFAPS